MVRSLPRCTFFAVAIANTFVRATLPYGSYGNAFGNTTLLCNSTIDKANASGVFTFPVDFPAAANINVTAGSDEINVPDPSWALTVDVAHDTTQTSLWYSTAGQNYSDDLAIGYDACAYQISGLPINTIELGQHDPGDCSTMLSWDCRNALMTRAAESAQMWTTYSTPPPYANLTTGVLPTICGNIYNALGDEDTTFPLECAKDFGFTREQPLGSNKLGTGFITLTGLNSSILTIDPCTLQAGEKTFHCVNTEISNDPYDKTTRDVSVMLSVFFTVANVERTSFNTGANATLTCVRVKDFSKGSRVSPTLPSGTPYHYGSSLSGGAIAGIVVGVIVIFAVGVGLCVWLWLRKRKQRRQTLERQKLDSNADREMTPPEAGGAQVSELSPVDRKAELDDRGVVELGGGGSRFVELDVYENPTELST